MSQLDLAIWCLAWVGMIIIVVARPVLKLFMQRVPEEAVVIGFKSVGIILAVVGVLLLIAGKKL